MISLKLPFNGKSIQELSKNVRAGVYPKLPQQFSDKLQAIIGQMLTVRPDKRPSAQQLLSDPIIIAKMKELNLMDDELEVNTQLLKTIQLPKQLSTLNSKLPHKKHITEGVNYCSV